MNVNALPLPPRPDEPPRPIAPSSAEARPSKVELAFLIFQVLVYAFLTGFAIWICTLVWSFADAVFGTGGG